jgi:hypothetical protein
MAPTRGTLDPQGCPLTRVTIFPEGIPAHGRDFDALIDTGFTGFAQMPQASAVDIGLTPTGTMDLTFSDGSTEAIPVAWASIRFGGRDKGRLLSSCPNAARKFCSAFTFCESSRGRSRFPSKGGTWSCLNRSEVDA